MFDLLVIGEINPDLILRGHDVAPAFGQAEKLVDEAALVIGSSSVIMACGASRLGLRVAFAGLVGDDLFGRFMLDQMQGRGIDISGCVIDSAVQTGFSVILAQPGGDRAILTYAGSIPCLTASLVDRRLLESARHIHVGSYFLLDGLRPDLPALFGQARANGATTSLDTNWDPSSRWEAADILRQTDVFLPNEAEARAISGRDSNDAAIEALAGVVPTLALKLGAAGALARRGSENARARPLPVQVVDTVGAGDSFDAGFITGHLMGMSLHETLQLAVACGSLSTRAAGGTAAQPSLEEAEAALAAV